MTKFSAQQQSQLAQIGVFLRENREKQSKSLEDIAIRTYIRPQLLNGIESGDPDLLPEPIFVQGFIRRYAENLGLNGKDLSAQFSVDSIPSTPRPTRQLVVEDSPTTRLTRMSADTSAAKAASTDSSAAKAAMFSAGSASPLEDSLVSAKETADRPSPADEMPLIIDDAVLDMPLKEAVAVPAGDTPETSDFSFSQTDLQTDLESDALKPDVFKTDIKADSDSKFQRSSNETSASNTESAGSNSFVGLGTDTKLPTADLPTSEDTFASKVAEFDRQNLTSLADPPDKAAVEPTAEPTAASVSNGSFDDDLPSAFTTAAAAPVAPVYTNPEPVGVEYGRPPAGPNLKPFVIGGVVAVLLTAVVVALASLFGGDRTPAVAEIQPPSNRQAVTWKPSAKRRCPLSLLSRPTLQRAPLRFM